MKSKKILWFSVASKFGVGCLIQDPVLVKCNFGQTFVFFRKKCFEKNPSINFGFTCHSLQSSSRVYDINLNIFTLVSGAGVILV